MIHPLPTICTARLSLEPLRVDMVDVLLDTERMIEQGKPVARRCSDDAICERLRRWAGREDAGRSCGTWMIGVEGMFAGRVALDRDEGSPHVHLSYALVPDARGQGLASEAGRAVRDWAFDHGNTVEIRAVIRPINDASIAVVTRLGMIRHSDSDMHNLVFCTKRPA